MSNYFARTIEGQIELNRWVRTTVFFCTLNGTINPIVYIFGSSEINGSVRNIFGMLFSLPRIRSFDETMNICSA